MQIRVGVHGLKSGATKVVTQDMATARHSHCLYTNFPGYAIQTNDAVQLVYSIAKCYSLLF